MRKWYVLAARVAYVLAAGVVAVFVLLCGGCGPEFRSEKDKPVTMKVGEYRTFTFTDRYTGDINWLMDDENIATVNHEGDGGDGAQATVHAVGAGTTDLAALDESLNGISWRIIVECPESITP